MTRSHGMPGDIRGLDEAIVRPTSQAGFRVHQGEAIGAAGQPDPTVRETVVRGEDLEGAVHEARQSVSRLRPDAAFHVLEDAADEVAREAVPLGIDRHARLLESHQTAIGPNPQTVVDARRNDRHTRARQAVGRCVALEAAGGVAEQAVLRRADPHPTLFVGEQRLHAVVRQPVVGTELGHAVGVDAIEPAAHGRHPERSIWRPSQRADVGVRHVRAPLVGADATVGDPRNSPVRADQQPTVPIVDDGSHEIARQAIGDRVRSEAAPAERVHTATIGADPERPGVVFEQAPDEVARQPISHGVLRESAAGEARHAAAIGRQPEISVAPLEQRRHERIADTGRGARVEEREADTIEAGRAFVGPHPQIAVARRRDREHRILREPVPFLPIELLIPPEHVVTTHRLGGGAGSPERVRDDQDNEVSHARPEESSHSVPRLRAMIVTRDDGCGSVGLWQSGGQWGGRMSGAEGQVV